MVDTFRHWTYALETEQRSIIGDLGFHFKVLPALTFSHPVCQFSPFLRYHLPVSHPLKLAPSLTLFQFRTWHLCLLAKFSSVYLMVIKNYHSYQRQSYFRPLNEYPLLVLRWVHKYNKLHSLVLPILWWSQILEHSIPTAVHFLIRWAFIENILI